MFRDLRVAGWCVASRISTDIKKQKATFIRTSARAYGVLTPSVSCGRRAGE